MPSRIGNYTLKLEKAPYISGYGSCAGEKEAAGPIGKEFDLTFDDPYLGQATWEKAESEMLRIAIHSGLQKGTYRKIKGLSALFTRIKRKYITNGSNQAATAVRFCSQFL